MTLSPDQPQNGCCCRLQTTCIDCSRQVSRQTSATSPLPSMRTSEYPAAFSFIQGADGALAHQAVKIERILDVIDGQACPQGNAFRGDDVLEFSCVPAG